MEQGIAGAEDTVLRTPGVLAWLRLARVFAKVDRASAEHLRRWGLSVAQFDVLAQVGATEGLSQQELAAKLLVTKGNVTQLLDRMQRDGLIVRCQEGRTNCLFLTVKGHRLYEEVVPAQASTTLRPYDAARLVRHGEMKTTMTHQINGIHHITAIAADPQRPQPLVGNIWAERR